MDDDAAPSPHVVLAAKPQALADVDIDALATAPSAAAAAATQGERLLKQMQEKASSGDGHAVGVKVLMTRVVPVAKQVRTSAAAIVCAWRGFNSGAGVEHGRLSSQEARAAAAASAVALSALSFPCPPIDHAPPNHKHDRILCEIVFLCTSARV
jgi:hypothetical protein